MDYTLAELEEELGPPAEFIPTMKSFPLLRKWALASGARMPHQVYGMSNAELVNLYHEQAEKLKHDLGALQRAAADIFARCVNAIQSEKVNPDFIREIVLREIEALPPKRIEIVTPQHIVILDGTQHAMTEPILRVCSLGHNVMLVGPAGCGKTTIGRATSAALMLPFYITSTINETHELTGFIDGHGVYHRTPFRDAFEFGGIWIADEIDAWDASALLAANAALANGFCRFPDSPVPVNRHPNFRVIATANTFGHGADRVYVGRNELDAASLDRFAVIPVTYDLTLERNFAGGNHEWLEYVWHIRKQVEELKIRHVVSSRAIINGAQGLAAGLALDDVKEWYLYKGMSSKDRAKIKEGWL